MRKHPFDPKLSVERPVALHTIEEWAETPLGGRANRGRVLSVVGSPGSGKSWLMAMARKQLETKSKLVFWTDLSPGAADSMSGYPLPDMTTDSGRAAWLENCVKLAQAYCPVVRAYDASVSFAAMFDALVEDICSEACTSRGAPIMLVDGINEIPSEISHYWQTSIFSHFLRRPCTLLVIAERDNYVLVDPYLRFVERVEFLGTLEKLESDRQLEKLFVLQSPPAQLNDVEAVKKATGLQKYTWTHPLINALLLDWVFNQTRAGWNSLSRPNSRTIIEEIIQPNSLNANAFALLTRLARWEVDKWTYEDLESELNLHINTPEINMLFQLGVVVMESSLTYKVADGVRELLRDGIELTPPMASDTPLVPGEGL